MEFDLAYWHWLVFGIALLIVEIFIPTFAVLWFGLGALLVGLLMVAFNELSLNGQLLIWGVSSTVFAIMWFKYFKPLMADRTKAGITREAVRGETGQVIRVPVEGNRGKVRFTIPVLGDDEWEFICEQEVALGDRVRIKELSGNTLIVVK